MNIVEFENYVNNLQLSKLEFKDIAAANSTGDSGGEDPASAAPAEDAAASGGRRL
jgi:hypothetical protein